METRTCSVEGCDRPLNARGFCSGHYQQDRAGKPIAPLRPYNPGGVCDFDGCTRKVHARGRCNSHYQTYSIRLELSPEDHRAMVDRQRGLCAICRRPPGARGLFVDHDHETGKVRGLLCHRCNSGLGSFRDDLEILRAALTYLAVVEA